MTEYSEVLIDTLMEGDTLKEIPLIKTVTSIYRIVDVVGSKKFHKKMQLFLEEVRAGEASEEKSKEFQERFETDMTFRDNVAEHIIEQVANFDDEFKAKILGRLFISLTQGYITWRRFLDLRGY